MTWVTSVCSYQGVESVCCSLSAHCTSSRNCSSWFSPFWLWLALFGKPRLAQWWKMEWLKWCCVALTCDGNFWKGNTFSSLSSYPGRMHLVFLCSAPSTLQIWYVGLWNKKSYSAEQFKETGWCLCWSVSQWLMKEMKSNSLCLEHTPSGNICLVLWRCLEGFISSLSLAVVFKQWLFLFGWWWWW